MMIFAGIGSRNCPKDVCETMSKISKFFFEREYILRSGGADGADKAFEKSVPYDEYKQIFRPENTTPEAIEFASRFHPNWKAVLKIPGAKELHGRNAQILLGKNLDSPVDFVVAWTKDGKPSGGTALGLIIAEKHNIPIYNIFNEEDMTKLREFSKRLR